MTLQSAIEAELPFLRAEAEARMRDTCRITRPGDGSPVFNPDTGQYENPAPVTVYEGKCRIPTSGGNSFGFTRNGAADQSFGVGEYPLDLPADTVGVEPGHEVTYLTAPDAPGLEGRVFGIVSPILQSQATKLRFKMKSVVAQ